MRTHDRSVDAAATKRLRLVALAVVAALVCLSLRVVRLPERIVERGAEGPPAETRALATLPPVVVTGP